MPPHHPQLEKLFNAARQAFEKRNYDYAVEMFKQCVEIEKNYGEAWGGLCAALSRKNQELGLTSSKISQRLTSGFGFMKGKAVESIAPSQQVAVALGHMISNPMDLQNRLRLARALEALGHKEGALAVYAGVVDVDPRNIEALKGAGAMNRDLGHIQAAQECYNAAIRANPADYEVSRAIKELAALETIGRGLSDASSYTDLLKDKSGADSLEQRHHLVKTVDEIDSEIQNLRKQLEAAPADVKLWKALGNFLFEKKKDFDGARDAFQKASELNQADATLWMKAEDCTLRKYDAQIVSLEPQVRAAPSDATKVEQLKKVRLDRNRFGVQSFEKRVQAHPTDTGLHFELGKYCYELAVLDRAQAGALIDRAITEFQMTVKDPKRKIDSHDYLGNAFRAKKMYDMAVTQFQKALETGVSPSGKQGLRILYNMGRTYEDEGKTAEAVDTYKKILGVDYSYRDTSQRVEKLSKT